MGISKSRRKNVADELSHLMLLPVIVILLPITGLAGCSSQSDLGDVMSNSAPPPQTTVQAPQIVIIIAAKVALSPLIGPPQNVSNDLVRKLDVAATISKIALLTDRGAVGDYRLKGYLAVTRTAKGVELSYIWDLFDNRGKRIDRAVGNEVITGTPSKTNVWSIIPQQIYQKIANQGIATVARRIPVQPAPFPVAPVPKVGLQ